MQLMKNVGNRLQIVGRQVRQENMVPLPKDMI